MGIIDRYIARHVIGGTAIALVLLVALFSIVELVDDIDSVGSGDYGMGGALQYLAMRIPGRVFALFPVSALIGSVMGLGLLTSSNELTVMRASGVSIARITTAVLKGGGVLVVLVILVGELLVPTSERLAYEGRSIALSQQIRLQSGNGLWVRDGLSFINIRRVLTNRVLADVYIYEFDEEYRLRVATHAEQARYEEGAGGDAGGSWTLEQIAQSEISDDGVLARQIDRAAWHSVLRPQQVSAAPIQPEGLSALGLLEHIDYLRRNGLDADRYELALWNKFVYPFATGIMVFVSVVLVLGLLREVSLGRRIVIGIVIGIVFHIVQKTAMHVGLVFRAGPFVSVLGPPLVFLLLGIWLMRRLR